MPDPIRIVARAAIAALVAAMSALAPGSSGAAVYKCAGEGGVPMYQEMPCPPGKALRDFQTDPPEITVLPGTAGAGGTQKSANRPAKDGKAAKESRSLRAAADPAERSHLRSGMTAGEVRARAGAPDTTAGAARGKAERWTWLPAPGDPDTITTVTLSNGVVTGVDRTVVKK